MDLEANGFFLYVRTTKRKVVFIVVMKVRNPARTINNG